VTLEAVSFEGHDCVCLPAETADVFVSTSVGPRILGLVGRHGNLMAVLPDRELQGSGGPPFRFYGGHRLWAAPEVPEVTYQPDDRPCTVTEIDGGVRVEAPPDGAGLEKTIEIRGTPTGWTVDHAVRNASGSRMRIAPWAITQVRLGGEVVIQNPSRGTGPQADRSLVLWPYSDLSDERVHLDRDRVRVRAEPAGRTLKLGLAPSDGRIGYRFDGEAFEKQIAVDVDAEYADRGAAVQVYLSDDFCELETLGPLAHVDPGATTTHREHWTIRGDEP
jgi:hypothetical protein